MQSIARVCLAAAVAGERALALLDRAMAEPGR